MAAVVARRSRWSKSSWTFAALALCLCTIPALAGLSADQKALYQQALAALGTPAYAITLAGRGDNPVLTDLITWQAMQQDDAPQGFAAYASALATHEGWPGSRAVRRQAERRMPSSLDADATLAFFGKKQPITLAGVTRYAAALNDTGRQTEAAQALTKFWREGDMENGEQKDFLARYRPMLAREDIAARVSNLLWDGQITQATALIPSLAAPDQAVAKARIALQVKGKGNPDALIPLVSEAKQDDPGLIYDRVRYRLKDDNPEGAAQLLRKVGSRGPSSEKWWKIREWTARDLLEKNQPTLAYGVAKNHDISATEGVAYTEIEWLAGWIALEHLPKPKAAEALAHFENAWNGGQSVNTRSKAAYWMGRAKEAMGEAEAARAAYGQAANYGNTFYGQLAAAELFGEVNIKAPGSMPVANVARQQFGNLGIVKAVRALSEIDNRTLALRFARSAMEDADDLATFTLFAELGQELKRPEISAFAGKIGGRKGYMVGADAYPTLPDGLNPVAERIGSTFAHAIIWQESAFNPEAKSGAGAEGLMQLMPATAKLEQKRTGMGGGKLSNASYNLKLGTSHMWNLLMTFNGYLPQAIAGYNAGSTRPAAWAERFGNPAACPREKGNVPRAAVNWIESIPFSETRDYVKYVLAADQVYRAVQNRGSAALTLPQRLTGKSCAQLAAN